jgi:hypothetical protein
VFVHCLIFDGEQSLSSHQVCAFSLGVNVYRYRTCCSYELNIETLGENGGWYINGKKHYVLFTSLAPMGQLLCFCGIGGGSVFFKSAERDSVTRVREVRVV